MPYDFGLPMISFYGNIYLYILVINTSKMITHILIESLSPATIILEYLINDPLALKLICPKLNLTMGPLVFPHNHIKVS